MSLIINMQLPLYPSHILDLAVSSRPRFDLDRPLKRDATAGLPSSAGGKTLGKTLLVKPAVAPELSEIGILGI
ncbi:MAG: hypothetical protein K8R46_14485 [Pirellulales bacterium]|nr:hypothetical protein [Pirellulales bacterium]